jgi:RNA polymerase sigma factor (sigma-70 family)
VWHAAHVGRGGGASPTRCSTAVGEGNEVASQAPDDGFTAVLAAARTGDAAAWSALYHATAPMLVAYLRAQRLPDPDDVAGEVLLEVVRDLHRFDGDERGFRSWVLAIAHHRLLDARRRAMRRPDESGAADELLSWPGRDDTEAEGLATVGLGELAPALAELTADQRTVLLLRVVGDLGIDEVAGVLGKRSGAVKQLQRRAVATLQRRLRHVPAGGRAEDGTTQRQADVAASDRLLEVVADAHLATDRGRRDG